MPISYNPETNEAFSLNQGGEWEPTKLAKNDKTGESFALDGNEWKPLPASKPKKEGGFLDSLSNFNSSVANGLMGGFYDEAIKAPIQTGVDAVFDMFGGPKTQNVTDVVRREVMAGNGPAAPPKFGGGYSANLAADEQQREQARTDMPYTSYGGELTGAVVSPLAKLLMNKGGPAATSWLGRVGQRIAGSGPAATTLPGRAIQGAGEGARIGAVWGAGNATGDLGDRAEGAGLGAGLGGVLGGVAPPLIEGAGKLVNKTVEVAVNKVRSAAFADRKIATAVRELGGGDLQKGTAEAARLLNDAGPDAALVDVLGMPGQRLARAASNATGEGSQIADDFISTRAAGRGGRLQSAADELAPNSFHADAEALSAKQKADAAPLYQRLFEKVSNLGDKTFAQWDDRLQRLLDNPNIKKGINRGMAIIRNEADANNTPFNPKEYAIKGFDKDGNVEIDGTPNFRTMDAAKRGLDDMLEAYRDPMTGKLHLDDMGRSLDQLRRGLLDKLDNMTVDPATGKSLYAEARAAWSGPAKTKDAMYMGRRFMRGDEEMTKATYAAMAPSEQEAFKVGVRREIGGSINKDTQAAVGKFADKKADTWNRLRDIFNPTEFSAFRKGIENERNKFAVDQFIGPRAGSKTAGTGEDLKGMTQADNPGQAAIVDAAMGNTAGALRGAKQWASDKWNAVDPKTAEDLAKHLLNLSPQEQQAYLAMLMKKVQVPQIARRSMHQGARAATFYGATQDGR